MTIERTLNREFCFGKLTCKLAGKENWPCRDFCAGITDWKRYNSSDCNFPHCGHGKNALSLNYHVFTVTNKCKDCFYASAASGDDVGCRSYIHFSESRCLTKVLGDELTQNYIRCVQLLEIFHVRYGRFHIDIFHSPRNRTWNVPRLHDKYRRRPYRESLLPAPCRHHGKLYRRKSYFRPNRGRLRPQYLATTEYRCDLPTCRLKLWQIISNADMLCKLTFSRWID